MAGKMDCAALRRYKDNMKKLNKQQAAQFTEAAVKELAARLLRKVKLRTPVGVYDEPVNFTTKEGKTVSFSPHTGKKGGTLRRGWTVGEVVKEGSTYTIEVINPIEYAPYVEYGHRTANHSGWVEGRFMLTISEQELKQDAPRILENKLKNFVEGVFNAK